MKSLTIHAVTLTMLLLIAPAHAAELELVQTIDLKGKEGGLDHVALDQKRDRLFVANKVNNTLDIVDLKTGKLLDQMPNQTAIQGVTYAPDIDKIFVGLGSNGLCNVFDGESYKIVKTIKFKEDVDNVRYHAPTKRVYVAHGPKMLGVVDAKTYVVKAEIPLPDSAEGFELEMKRPRLYLAVPGTSEMVVIDTEKNVVAAKYAMKLAKAAHPVALDEANQRVYIGCRKDPMVVVLDTETGKEISAAPIAAEVDDLFIDLKRGKLFASCGEGFIVVLKQTDKDHVEVVEKVETVKGAKTCLYVPETGRLYLAVPRQAGKEGPEIRVYQAKP